MAAVPAAAVTAPATARLAATTVTATEGTIIPHGLLPMATSWTTARRGVVLAYPSRTAGARPYLLETGNEGKSWRSLTAPPVTYPADNDQPNMVWGDGVIAVTDGTHVVATRGSAKHWQAESLAGVSGSFYVGQLAIADGRVFALVTTANSATVYSGTTRSDVLSPVKGLSLAGSVSYGDISTAGGLQIDLGSDYASEKYWYSKNGTRFTAAPLPCPATTQPWLGGVRSGKVIALCTGGASAISPGQTDAQLSVAAHLGGTFSATGEVFDPPNVQAFAAASPQAATAATEGNLAVTTDAGKTWAPELPQGNGQTCADLSFPDATTGFIACSTVNNSLDEVDTVYRTANSGRTWTALTLP